MINRYGIQLLEELNMIAENDKKRSYQEQKVHQTELIALEEKLQSALSNLQIGKGDTYGLIPK